MTMHDSRDGVTFDSLCSYARILNIHRAISLARVRQHRPSQGQGRLGAAAHRALWASGARPPGNSHASQPANQPTSQPSYQPNRTEPTPNHQAKANNYLPTGGMLGAADIHTQRNFTIVGFATSPDPLSTDLAYDELALLLFNVTRCQGDAGALRFALLAPSDAGSSFQVSASYHECTGFGLRTSPGGCCNSQYS